MNSAKVAGGVAPLPEHSSLPELQSPVRQVNFPVESWEQSVRPQKRPPQEAGGVIDLEPPDWRTKPVVEIGAIPALERSPGQTV